MTDWTGGPEREWFLELDDEEPCIMNLGCIHKKFAYSHCGEMACPNYVNKCPLHCMAGTSTATCNLERAKSLIGLSDETRKLIEHAIALSPALTETILLIADLSYRDGAESVE